MRNLVSMTEEEFLIQLGLAIAKARRAKGISQVDLSAQINMDQPNLSAIENGRQNASSLTLKKIADALGVGVKVFFE